MNVIVLGHNGMLGNATVKYLKSKGVSLEVTNTKWPTSEFKDFIRKKNVDFIINCVGAIPQKTNEFDINFELPIWLDYYASSKKIIHPGTDCEIDNDAYGKSKKFANDFISSLGRNTKILKTSIIGHELNTNFSLLDWFLNEEIIVKGYSNHYWNGNTTLQWAKTSLQMMNNWNDYDKCNIIVTECRSKLDLLKLFRKVYEKDIAIESFVHSKTVNNKCLEGTIKVPNLEDQLNELRKFYGK